MSTIELTEEEIATLRQGLVSAAMRYRQHAQTALEVGEEGGISATEAQAHAAQFTKQADDANALYAKIVNADKITVTTSEEESDVPPRDPNLAWLRENSAKYPGCWVALRDGWLLGYDLDRGLLHRELEAKHELGGAFFAYVPA